MQRGELLRTQVRFLRHEVLLQDVAVLFQGLAQRRPDHAPAGGEFVADRVQRHELVVGEDDSSAMVRDDVWTIGECRRYVGRRSGGEIVVVDLESRNAGEALRPCASASASADSRRTPVVFAPATKEGRTAETSGAVQKQRRDQCR